MSVHLWLVIVVSSGGSITIKTTFSKRNKANTHTCVCKGDQNNHLCNKQLYHVLMQPVQMYSGICHKTIHVHVHILAQLLTVEFYWVTRASNGY